MAIHNVLAITVPGHQGLRNGEEGEVCFNVHNVHWIAGPLASVLLETLLSAPGKEINLIQ